MNNAVQHPTQPALLLAAIVALLVTLPQVSVAVAQSDDPTENEAGEGDSDESEPLQARDDAEPEAGEPEASDAEAADAEASDAEAAEAGDAEAGDAEAGDAEAGDAEAGDAEPEAEEPEPPPPADRQAVDDLDDPDEEVEEEAAADEDEEEAPPPAPDQKPWRNSFFTWTHGVTFNSFLRDAQLSYNPTYLMNFSFLPRWYIAPTTFLFAVQSMQTEMTDTDTGVVNRDPIIFDTAIELRHLIPWEGFVFMLQARLGLPTSRDSQAAQRFLQVGAGTTIVKMIPEANLTLAGLVAYRTWLAGSNVPQARAAQPDICPNAPGPGIEGMTTVTCNQIGGASAARDIFLTGVAATWLPFEGFSINLSFFIFTIYGFDLAPAYVNVDTSEEPIRIDDGSPNHWRNYTFVSLSIAYDFLPWMNVGLGIQNSGFVASAYNPDGSIAIPFTTPDTQVFIGATFTVDQVYEAIFEADDDGSQLTPEEMQRRRQGLAGNPAMQGAF